MYSTIYINGPLNKKIHGEILCFSDDTVIIFSGDCLNSVEEKVNVGLKNVKSYLDNNSLQIYYDESSFLHFKINSNHNTELNTFIKHENSCTFYTSICCCSSIKKACSVKYLDLYLDDHLKWHIHLSITHKCVTLTNKVKITC